MLPFGPTTPAGACTVFGKGWRKERFSDEGEKSECARKREDESPSVGGGRKSVAEERQGEVDGGRLRDGKVVDRGGSRTRWVAASKGCFGWVAVPRGPRGRGG